MQLKLVGQALLDQIYVALFLSSSVYILIKHFGDRQTQAIFRWAFAPKNMRKIPVIREHVNTWFK